MLPMMNNNQLAPREDRLIHSDQKRAIAEVQAALVIAASRPRDEVRARERIMNACLNINLANSAVYNYPRGGQNVSGPSIRLAEAIARYWENLNYGFRELSREDGISQCEAFSWDLETNVKAVRQFQVRHIRDTKQGGKPVTDERDIYEIVANNAERRVRACIMKIIPMDIFDEAMEKCRQTSLAAMKNEDGGLAQTIEKMVKAFTEYGVTKKAIEKRFGRKASALEISHVMDLRRIYASIKDGMCEAKEWFEVEPEKSSLNQALNQAANNAKQETQARPQETFECPHDSSQTTLSICETACERRKGCPAFTD